VFIFDADRFADLVSRWTFPSLFKEH